MSKQIEYKKTSLPWCSQIPNDWEVKQLKYCFQFTTGFTPPTKDENLFNGDNVWVTIGDMGERYISDSKSKITDEAIEKYNGTLVKSGSLLFSFKLSVGKVAFATKELYTNEAIIAIPDVENLNLNFFYYTLPFQLLQNANENIYGAKILNQDLIKNAYLVIPPFNQQTAISKFLDEKTAEIDNLIFKKQSLIDCLKEELKTIIYKAVTKGINPDAQLKDSNVVWLGEIPKNWTVKKLKYILNFLDSKRIPLSADERGKMTNKIYDYYGASGIIDKVEDYIFDGTYILLGEDGANLITRSTELAFIATGKFWVNNHAHILEPKEGNIFYYKHLLECYDYFPLISGSAQPKLTAENLANIEIIEPPQSEQNLIIDFLNDMLGDIHNTIRKIEQEIELIKEYRTSLINEVVTGKKILNGYENE